VLLVVDQKHLPEELDALKLLVEQFPRIPIRTIDPAHTDPAWQSPVCHYNKGALEARGEFLILSNPENFHVADILAGLDEEFEKNPQRYVICGCLSVFDQSEPISTFQELQVQAVDRWYQHSEHKPRDLHFCSALLKELYWKAGGFDEEFRFGIAYDDDAFREAVRATGAEFVRRDDLLTYHLYHERSHQQLRDYRQRLEKNRQLYLKKWGKSP